MTVAAAASLRRVTLIGQNYVLGECRGSYAELPEREAVMQQFSMHDDAPRWGWGTYCYTRRDYFELAHDCVARALADAAVDPMAIDRIYFTGSSFRYTFEQMNAAIGRLITTLGMRNAIPQVSLGAGCAAMMSTIHHALPALRGGLVRNALVLSGDVVRADADRFYQFCIMSDSVSACLLSAERDGGLAIVQSVVRMDPSLMLEGDSVYLPGQREIFVRASEDVLRGAGCRPSDVEQVLPSNIYIPFLKIYGAAASFSPSQLFLRNIPRISHCYASDPLINLVDYVDDARPAAGAHLLMHASSLGHVASVLVQVQ